MSFPSLLGLESMLGKIYKFGCKCISSQGELIGISSKDFFAKIYTHSKSYVDR